MFTDGLGLKWAGPVVISDVERFMPRNILDIRKFVFAEIVVEDFSVLVREIFH